MRTLFFLLIFLFSSPAFSQSKQFNHYAEFGVSANAYKGDLNHSYQKFSSAFHLRMHFLRKQKFTSYSIGVMIGNVIGNNPDYSVPDISGASPNLFFNTRFWSVGFERNFNWIRKERFRFYSGIGVSLFHFTPKDEDNKSLLDQFNTRAQDESYGTVLITVPVFTGVSYKFTNGYKVSLQGGFQNVGDHIDNISAWGNKKGADHILMYKFSIHIPLGPAE